MPESASSSPIIVYSHGFGVAKDDRELFTAIADGLPGYQHIMFDYNHVDPANHNMVVTPLDKQAGILEHILTTVQHDHPGAPVYIVAHSQGCVVAAQAKLPLEVRGAVFLAPPATLSADRMKDIFDGRNGTVINFDSSSQLRRSDGSITTVEPDYWQSISDIHPVISFNRFAQHTSTTIVHASQDEVLGLQDFTGLAPTIRQQALKTDHNFAADGRRQATALVRSVLEGHPLPANALDDRQDFVGTKGLVYVGERVIIYRRDANAPKYPLKLDVAGGGREPHESPVQTFIREVQEEFGLPLALDDVVYSRSYAASNGSGDIGYYMVAKLPASAEKQITFGDEGIGYQLMSLDEFIARTDAWPAYQDRADDYRLAILAS